MKLQRVAYQNLSAKQKEIYNFQKIAGVLADYGFNCTKLHDDWQGADFLAYHKDGEHTLKVQLKARLTIAKKYQSKGVHMAFPVNGTWYLIPHDELVEVVRRTTSWLTTESWLERSQYSSAHPSSTLLAKLSEFALASAPLVSRGRTRHDLKALVSEVPKEYTADELDWGPPVGKEEW